MMHPRRMTPGFRIVALYTTCAVAIATALSLIPSVRAADQPIDLDKNAANGAESKISTKVLQSYPVKIENAVFNNAAGTSYNFKWPGAGPGGFASFITAGPGVGTKWVWSTVYQVYNISSPLTFEPARSISVFGTPPRGVEPIGAGGAASFAVAGKSISPSSITLSDASLSSSLITFFSPEKTVATCGFECAPGECELFLQNQTGGTVTIAAEQLDCCPDPHQLVCGGECTSYLTDTQNCGGCGNLCAADEICTDGACACPAGEAQCGAGCIDPQVDPANCGTCQNVCPAAAFCGNGECVCPGSQTACGADCVDSQTDQRNCGTCGNVCGDNEICAGGTCSVCNPPLGNSCNNQCVNIYVDPLNCGACGNVCDFSACPFTKQGTCSLGTSCICAPDATAPSASSLLRFRPVGPERAGRSNVVKPQRSAKLRRASARARRVPAPVNQISVPTGPARALNPNEALVCDIAPIEQVVPSGGTYTQTQTGGRFGKEIQTTVSIAVNGQIIAQGPCPQVVPVLGADTSGVILSPIAVATQDASGDGLCQPGEAWCNYFVTVASVGDSPCVNPFATLSSPPDPFNANDITLLNASSPYPNLPAYPGDGVPLERKTNTTAFSITTPSTQASDVGRPFQMSVTCANIQGATLMPFTLGIGSACVPESIDGKSYDRLDGFQSPVRATLVASGNPVNYSAGKFNHGSTIPLKLSLGCGPRTLNDAEINPNPQIVDLVHATLGPQSLLGINGNNGANPDDPGFSCSGTGCDYQFRTAQLPVGTYIISVQMPDNRVYQAGFTIRP